MVRAGVVPALRNGAVLGSERWLFASMVPGAHPFAELEAALLRSTIDAPGSLAAQLEDETLGLLRAALRVVPDDMSRLVLVIDQFEELFTLVDDETERRRFLANLVAALDDPHARVVVILTLRADSYHRPLGYAEFASRLASNVVNVLPLTSDELEAAAQEPTVRSGVSLEPALLAELLADVIGEPGALPIFQYAITELFDRRNGNTLTVASYRAMGGVRGALSRRADDLYHRLTVDEQEATRQLFLRLVTITEHDDWGRRRVPASEIVSLDVDVVTMESVIDQLGRHRFLAFDRDHSSAAPTVEVAHEALLWEWDRLSGWIEDGRHDVKRRAILDAAVVEWVNAKRDADYLLTGNRLAEYERWRDNTSMSLTAAEHDYLDASLTRRDEIAATELARADREASSGDALVAWGLIAGAAALVAAAVVVLVIFVLGPDTPPSVALVYAGRGGGDVESLVADGLDHAVEDFDVRAREVTPPFTDLDDSLDRIAGSDLVIARQEVAGASTASIAARHPDLKWGYVDIEVPGSPSVVFAEQEGSFLVGAAAALTSRTGTIGFVGGFQFLPLERTRAGFEAGARAVNPSIKILASYLDVNPSAFIRDDLALAAATDMYERGADVILHVAGSAGIRRLRRGPRRECQARPPGVGDRHGLRSVPRCRRIGTTACAHVDDQEVRRRGVRTRPHAGRWQAATGRTGARVRRESGRLLHHWRSPIDRHDFCDRALSPGDHRRRACRAYSPDRGTRASSGLDADHDARGCVQRLDVLVRRTCPTGACDRSGRSSKLQWRRRVGRHHVSGRALGRGPRCCGYHKLRLRRTSRRRNLHIGLSLGSGGDHRIHDRGGRRLSRTPRVQHRQGATTFPRVGACPWHGRGQGFNSPQLHRRTCCPNTHRTVPRRYRRVP